MTGVKAIYILGNFCWYRICSFQVLIFKCFYSSRNFLSWFWVVFWPEPPKILSILFDQWWHGRWCIRYATVFIEILNGWNWVKKLIFKLILRDFLFMLSYTLLVMSQDFANLKILLFLWQVSSIQDTWLWSLKLFVLIHLPWNGYVPLNIFRSCLNFD